MAGAFNWRIYHIDPRLSSIVAVKKYHTHPVLCLAVDDRYIISGSEDRTVCVYDRRADGLVKTLTVSWCWTLLHKHCHCSDLRIVCGCRMFSHVRLLIIYFIFMTITLE